MRVVAVALTALAVALPAASAQAQEVIRPPEAIGGAERSREGGVTVIRPQPLPVPDAEWQQPESPAVVVIERQPVIPGGVIWSAPLGAFPQQDQELPAFDPRFGTANRLLLNEGPLTTTLGDIPGLPGPGETPPGGAPVTPWGEAAGVAQGTGGTPAAGGTRRGW